MIFRSKSEDLEILKRSIDSQQIVVNEFARSFGEEISKLRERVAQLEKIRPSVLSPEDKGRLDDLEIWRGKVHKMLIEISPNTGNDKLSKFGKGFSALYRRG